VPQNRGKPSGEPYFPNKKKKVRRENMVENAKVDKSFDKVEKNVKVEKFSRKMK